MINIINSTMVSFLGMMLYMMGCVALFIAGVWVCRAVIWLLIAVGIFRDEQHEWR